MPSTDPRPSARPPVRPAGTDSPGRAGLHAETTGHEGGPRLVLAHGFTQTGRLWGALASDLATDHELVAVDLPGHGGSGDLRADVPAGAARLGTTGGPAAYLGYSMGARHCLQLALDRPDLVTSLILVSGTAGLEGVGERAARRAADEALADELDPPVQDLGSTGNGPSAAARLHDFLDRWLAQPLFADLPASAAGVEERRRNTASGLAWSLRLAGTGTQAPAWDRLADLRMPVLVVTGAGDAKFTALGQRMALAIGANAHHVAVAGAGHAPHLQQPEAVAALVRAHLAPRA